MIVTKILIFILMMAILNVLKEAFRFYVAFSSQQKYESSVLRSVITMLSIAYILTIIFCGF